MQIQHVVGQSPGRTMGRYDKVSEEALLNIEALFDYWCLRWRKIGESEYDFISPTRRDQNYGACRFNSRKNRGKDFGSTEVRLQNRSAELQLDDKDFSPGNGEQFIHSGFDVIGLCQRVHSASSYGLGAKWLQSDLEQLRRNGRHVEYSRLAADERQRQLERELDFKIKKAKEVWDACRYYPFADSVGSKYLQSRGLSNINEPHIRFHPSIHHKQTRSARPALLFRVSRTYDSEFKAVHRIYLEGTNKAKVDNPKMALGAIQGNAIWFGTPGDTLVIAEGPEEALTYRTVFPFVACSVYASNFHSLAIPDTISTLLLAPDADEAGLAAYARALQTYPRKGLTIKRISAQ